MIYSNMPDEIIVSHSSLNLWSSCQRKWEARKLLRYPKGSRSISGDAGNCLHRGYQEYLRSGDKDKAAFRMLTSYPIDLCQNPSHDRSVEACYATLEAMIDTPIMFAYDIASVKLPNGEIVTAIEVPFKIQIKGLHIQVGDKIIPFAYVGFIDAIMYDRVENKFIVLDIKTHRQLQKNLTAKFALSEQCLPYGLILQKVLGKEIFGYSVRYMAVYVDIKNPDVKTYPFEKSILDVNEWAKGLYLTLSDIKRGAEMAWFKRSGDHCFNFNRTCEFFEYCQSRDIDLLTSMIEREGPLYKERNDKPWFTMDLELVA